MASSRIEVAKRRVARVKRSLAAVAAVSFLAVIGLARESHAGSTATHSNTGSVSSVDDSTYSNDNSSSDGYLAPSTSTPQVQTNVS